MQTGNNPLAQAAALMQRGDAAGAYKLCQQLIDRMPQEANLWYLVGMAAFRLGRGEEALQHLDRALEIRPRGPIMRMNRGQVRIALGRPDEGVEDLEVAIQAKPDLAEAHERLTAVLAQLGRHAEAIEACRRALQRFPNALEIRARLAAVLEQKSLLDEARQEAEAVLRAQPGHDRAEFTLAKIEARGGDLAAARKRLEGLLKRRLAPAQVSAIAGELARILEKLGAHEAAFEAAERANRASLEMVPPALRDSRAVLERVSRCRQFFGPDRSPPAADQMAGGREPPIFLVGFPRSGTTLTEQILSAGGHARASDEQPIIPSLLAELCRQHGEENFPALLADLTAEELAALRERYWVLAEEMCGPLPQDQRFLDKLPLNLADLGLIHWLFPEARVLVLLRDPRDVCVSCFFNQFVPNEAMIQFTSFERTVRFYTVVMGLWLHYREALQLDYREVRYEDLVGDLETTVRSLYDFCGLRWTDAALKFHEKVSERDIRTPSYTAVNQPIYKASVRRWQRYEPQIQDHIAPLKPFVERFGYE